MIKYLKNNWNDFIEFIACVLSFKEEDFELDEKNTNNILTCKHYGKCCFYESE